MKRSSVGDSEGRKDRRRIKESFSSRFFTQGESLAPRVFLFEHSSHATSEVGGEPFSQRYKKVQRLGEGTSSTVWLCEGEGGRLFAVKETRTRSSEIVKRAVMEARLLRGFSHKNIIGVRELYMDKANGDLHLVMEYFSGSEMGACLQASAYSEKVARILFRQLLEGLRFLHSRGVVHRDLKPQNLLVSPRRLNRTRTQNRRFQCRQISARSLRVQAGV